MIATSGAAGGLTAGLVVLIVLLWGFGLFTFVIWILSIIDIARRPDWQWRLAGKDRILWLVLVVLVNVVSLFYWWGTRRRLQEVERSAAAGAYGPGVMGQGGWEPAPVAWVPPAATPPAGWYPDPYGTAASRWWDGRGWSEHTR